MIQWIQYAPARGVSKSIKKLLNDHKVGKPKTSEEFIRVTVVFKILHTFLRQHNRIPNENQAEVIMMFLGSPNIHMNLLFEQKEFVKQLTKIVNDYKKIVRTKD